MKTVKYYSGIEIVECHEPLVRIPVGIFELERPHPYARLGAPYEAHSPYSLRQGTLERLVAAAERLSVAKPGWRIKLFDAYRPVAVQRFMVERTFAGFADARGLRPDLITVEQEERLWAEVYQYWALPSDDPAMPPPHSTGGAIDVTLVDGLGVPVPMGTEIDELTERARPDFFLGNSSPNAQQYQANRDLLRFVMESEGFRRNPNEWWHYCYGDQMWAFIMGTEQRPTDAIYGRVD